MKNKSEYIEILSWNVNGIRSSIKKGFLTWLEKSNADIVCVQETKISPDKLTPQITEVNGYESLWSSATEKKGYSGVATFTKLKPKNIAYGFGVKRFDNEGRIIVTEFDHFTLLNIYFPNGQKDENRLKYKMDFYDETLNYCQSLRKKGRRVIVSGDVNTAHKEIDLEHPKANSKTSGFLQIERDWIDKFIKSGFIDSLRIFNPQPKQYSWWDYKTRARERNVGWRIDYHFISEELEKYAIDGYILNKVYGSDHCPVGIKLKF